MQENKNQSNGTLISKKDLIYLPVEILYHILSKIPLKERVSVAIALSLTCAPFYQQLSQAVIETENALLKFELKKSAYAIVFWTKMPPSQQPSIRTIFEFLEIQFKRAKGQAKVQQLMLEMANKTHEAFKILLQKLTKIPNIKSLIDTGDGQAPFNLQIETQNSLFILFKSVLIHADLMKLDNPALKYNINQIAAEVFQSLKIQPYEAIWGLLIHILLLKEHSSKTVIETVIETGNQTEKTMKRINQAAYGLLMSSGAFYMSELYILTVGVLIVGFILLATTYSNKSEQTLRREVLGAFEALNKALPIDTDKKEKDESNPLSFFNQNKIHKILTEKEQPIEKKEDDYEFQF